MALEKNTNGIFLSIGDGKITKRVKTPTADSTQRALKDGKVINEEIYDSVSGLIKSIKTYDHPSYGRFWNVEIQDGEENYILQMNYSGGYSSAFLKTLPNVDLTKRVRFSPSMKMEGDKKKVTLFLNQDGKALKHAYTRENPNGLPEMKQIKVKGKMTWDDSEMMEFLERMVVEEIMPQLGGEVIEVKAKPQPATAGLEDADDLPF